MSKGRDTLARRLSLIAKYARDLRMREGSEYFGIRIVPNTGRVYAGGNRSIGKWGSLHKNHVHEWEGLNVALKCNRQQTNKYSDTLYTVYIRRNLETGPMALLLLSQHPCVQ